MVGSTSIVSVSIGGPVLVATRESLPEAVVEVPNTVCCALIWSLISASLIMARIA